MTMWPPRWSCFTLAWVLIRSKQPVFAATWSGERPDVAQRRAGLGAVKQCLFLWFIRSADQVTSEQQRVSVKLSSWTFTRIRAALVAQSTFTTTTIIVVVVIILIAIVGVIGTPPLLARLACKYVVHIFHCWLAGADLNLKTCTHAKKKEKRREKEHESERIRKRSSNPHCAANATVALCLLSASLPVLTFPLTAFCCKWTLASMARPRRSSERPSCARKAWRTSSCSVAGAEMCGLHKTESKTKTCSTLYQCNSIRC